jgi:hypothetical protein
MCAMLSWLGLRRSSLITTPVLLAYFPVRNDARKAEQTGELATHWRKFIPWAASRSMWGVTARRSPA